MKHVYTLMQRNGDPEASREFWMPDDQVKECFECNDKFTTFRRRHVFDLILINFDIFIKLLNFFSTVEFVVKYFVTNVLILKYQRN